MTKALMLAKLIALPVFAGCCLSCTANASDIQVKVFSAETANVNCFIFSDRVGSLIVDTTRNSKDAMAVVKFAAKHGAATPSVIFITHGHPDHYLGLGVLKQAFPSAKVFVASQAVKDDLIASAHLMEQLHVLDDEPLMKPKTEKNPDGFDYEGEIRSLAGKALKMPGGEKIEVLNSSLPTEAEHETMLYVESLNSLFASDLAYNGVHLWMGPGVSADGIKNWQAELHSLEREYHWRNPRVYPGHGQPTDAGVFAIDYQYISDLLSVAKASATQEEAKSAMIKRYPKWKNADFILVQSIKNQFKLLKK